MMQEIMHPVRSQRRLLVVEDERIVALDLRGALEDLGYTVIGTAASSDEALRTADERRPDLVLMDIRIAGASDGIQAASLLRSRYQLPVVYLTANADAATLERAPATQPARHPVKPAQHPPPPPSPPPPTAGASRRHEAEQAQRQAHEREKAELEQQTRRASRRARRLRREATIDPLTGLHNRRFLEQVMKRELSFAQREGHAVGAILVDLDRFKQLNDSYGHAAGDAALRAVGQFLRSRLRAYDVACRYGGDEIVIIVPGADTADAIALAEQLRAGIEQLGLGDAD